MQVKKCLYCGKEFESNNEQKQYCSASCARKGYHKRTYKYAPIGKKIINCKYCKKEFEVNLSGRVSQYCSRSCKNKFKYAKKNPTGLGNCLECGKEIVLHYNNKGETKNKFCSQNCGENYRDKLNPERVKNEINKPHRRYNVYFHGAKQRNIIFNLSFNQFLTFWNKPCSYCNSEIKGVGIDRVDNNIGYEINNCVPCCEICNRMKLKLSLSDFLSHIQKIINHTALVKPQDSIK